MRKVLLPVAALLVMASAAFAQVPKTPEQVPAYPGATVVSEQGSAKDETASGKAPAWIFALERVSTTTASVEQVAQFYAGKFGVPVEQDGGADPNDLEPGQLSSVGSSVEYWDQGWIDESADPVKAGFQKRQRLPGAETWARGAGFAWAYKNAEKDPYAFSLTIADKSVPDEDPTRYSPLTEIRLSIHMINNEKMAAQQEDMRKNAAASQQASAPSAQDRAAAEAAQKAAADAAAGALMGDSAKIVAEMATAPSEKKLGVAIYPGARYDAELSGQESMFMTDGARMYVFGAPAKPNEVVQFYVKHTGNQVALASGKTSVIPINFGKPAQKGDTPPLKDTVTIAGPTDAGMTVIMILKQGPGWTGQAGAGR